MHILRAGECLQVLIPTVVQHHWWIFFLRLAAHCLLLWEAQGRIWEWLRGSCTAPHELLRRGQLAPLHGAQTAGEEAPKPTKFTKKSEGTKQEKGRERRRNQRQVQMEHRPKHLSSGLPPASLSACKAIPKALGRGELSTLAHVALNPLWESG